MRDHTKLRAFELADALVLNVYRATRGFPDDEKFGLTSQLRRAAISIASNIVEGAARSSLPEYVRFLEIAYGSAKESNISFRSLRDLVTVNQMQFLRFRIKLPKRRRYSMV